VHLYIVLFREGRCDEGDNEEDDYEDEDDYRTRVDLYDPWLADKLSDNENLFDVDVDGGGAGAGPSTQAGGGGGVGPSTKYDGNGEGGEEGDDDNNTDEGNNDDNNVEGDDDDNNVDMSEGGGSFMRSFEAADVIRSDFPKARWHYRSHQATPSRLE